MNLKDIFEKLGNKQKAELRIYTFLFKKKTIRGEMTMVATQVGYDEASTKAKLIRDVEKKEGVGFLDGADMVSCDSMYLSMALLDFMNEKEGFDSDSEIPLAHDLADGVRKTLKELDTLRKSLSKEGVVGDILKESKGREKKKEEKPKESEPVVDKKSELMKEIIEKKDKKLFEKNKGQFTEYEVKYLKDKIKN